MFKKIQTLPRHFKTNISNTSSPSLNISSYQNDIKYSSNEKLSINDNNSDKKNKIIGTSTVGRRTIIARKSVANYYDKHNGSMISLDGSQNGLFNDSIKNSKEKSNRGSIFNLNFSDESENSISKNNNCEEINDDISLTSNNNNNINNYNNYNNGNDSYQPTKTTLIKVKHSRTKSLKNIISGSGLKRSQTSESINVYGSNSNINMTYNDNNQKDDSSIYSDNKSNIKKRYDKFFLSPEPPDEQTVNNLFEKIMVNNII